MGVFLRRYFEPGEVDRSTGEVVREARNRFEKVIGERDELERDFSFLTLHKGTDREVTIIFEKHTTYPSTLDPTGLVASFCNHGEALHPVTGERPRDGSSWVRAGLLEVILTGTLPGAKVKCHCEDPDWAT